MDRRSRGRGRGRIRGPGQRNLVRKTTGQPRPGGLSSPEPLENLPQDLNHNFSLWFYGSFRSFRRHTKERPLPDLRPLVQRFLFGNINDRFDPKSHNYLTENLSGEEPEPLKELITYKLTIEAPPREASDDLTPVSSMNQVPSLNQDLPSNGNSSEIKDVSIKVISERTYVDRRRMMMKKELKGRELSVIKPNSATTLISPDENCDSDEDSKIPIIEIDCDTATE